MGMDCDLQCPESGVDCSLSIIMADVKRFETTTMGDV